ncbi:hypothetical protein KAT36_04635, partial [Candidatus Pacearchaeota archaeon]|nr:hypothetical protein [Candidatus Pacearchaeota archaeon]
MRKEIVMGFLFLMSFSFVMAGSCDDDQTIMRLYSETNSHVSAWDQNVGSYVEEICYDEIFGLAYSGGSPHDCTGANRVLSLHDVKNSHAASVTDSDYNYEVCYGDLSCVYDESVGSECSNDGEIVARMYSKYNSHVSGVSDTNYGVKICCNAAGAGVYWADMNGNKISEADFGDSVWMIMTGASSVHNFEIFEEDALVNDEIRTVMGSIIDGNL